MKAAEKMDPVRKSKCNVIWYEDGLGVQRWRCKSQITAHGFKQESTNCWKYQCPGRREEVLHQILKTPDSLTCQNYECSNKVASDRKKYCSDKCRKQKARVDYEARNPGRKRGR